MGSDQAQLLLMKQLKGADATPAAPRVEGPDASPHTATSCLAELNKHPVEGFSAGLKDEANVFEWEVMIMGPPDTA